jgi:hypothetical protein
VSLHGNPVVISAQLPEAREAEIRVGIAGHPSLRDGALDTVRLEVRIGGTVAAAVTTSLGGDQVHEARALAASVADGLRRGQLAPSTSSLELFATGRR